MRTQTYFWPLRGSDSWKYVCVCTIGNTTYKGNQWYTSSSPRGTPRVKELLVEGEILCKWINLILGYTSAESALLLRGYLT